MTVLDAETAVDRFDTPLYTRAEAAQFLGLSPAAFRRMTPLLTTLGEPGQRRRTIPFIGLVEGYVLTALRASGMPFQRLRPVLEHLDTAVGLKHALASTKLLDQGADILRDELGADVDRDLQRIEFGADGFAVAIPLPGFRAAELVADARRCFGQPVLRRGGARLEDVLSRFKAERDIDLVSAEYGIPRDQLEDALAVLVRAA